VVLIYHVPHFSQVSGGTVIAWNPLRDHVALAGVLFHASRAKKMLAATSLSPRCGELVGEDEVKVTT
jgi:hypothetical protein